MGQSVFPVPPVGRVQRGLTAVTIDEGSQTATADVAISAVILTQSFITRFAIATKQGWSVLARLTSSTNLRITANRETTTGTWVITVAWEVITFA